MKAIFALLCIFNLSFAFAEPPKVVVVGAGLAGLTTAYRLQQVGYDVEVFEARGRVGGRVFTVQVGGRPAELGGQNLLDGGKAENILSLIEELGLETVLQQEELHVHYLDGDTIVDASERLQKVYGYTAESLRTRLEQIRLASNNMQDMLETLFQEDKILYETIKVYLEAYEGQPIEKLSLAYMETLFHMLMGGLSSAHPNAGGEKVYIDHLVIKGGNSLLTEALGAKLTSRIHLNAPLTSLTKGRRFFLTFGNGEAVEADSVILAIPCSTFEDIQFDPEVLPSAKLAKICSIPYGKNSKIMMPSTSQQKYVGSITNGRTIAFSPGDLKIRTLYYVNEYSRFTADTIEKVFSIDRPMIEKAFGFSPKRATVASEVPFANYDCPVGHSWPNDPYVKGSYSSLIPGQEEIYTALTEYRGEKVKELFAPHEGLFFVGEHASLLLEFGGTMEAAVESAERTVRLLKAR